MKSLANAPMHSMHSLAEGPRQAEQASSHAEQLRDSVGYVPAAHAWTQLWPCQSGLIAAGQPPCSQQV